MNKILVICISVCMFLVGCSAPHEHTWKEATCEEPKICERCNIVEGEAIGHKWKEATCEEPKICERCNIVEGEAIGHKWQEASCTSPKTCSVCKKVEGGALGHTVQIGKCNNCNTVLNYEVIQKIHAKINEGGEMFELIGPSIELLVLTAIPGSDSSEYMYYIGCCYDEVRIDLLEAESLCGDYSELSVLKGSIRATVDSIPATPTAGDSNTALDYALKTKSCMEVYINVLYAKLFEVEEGLGFNLTEPE